jgi:hypothetical protein
MGNAMNGSSGEAGKAKMAKLETASADNARSHRGKGATAVEIAVQAAAVMTAAVVVRAAQDGTRGLAEAGRSKERVLT